MTGCGRGRHRRRGRRAGGDQGEPDDRRDRATGNDRTTPPERALRSGSCHRADRATGRDRSSTPSANGANGSTATSPPSGRSVSFAKKPDSSEPEQPSATGASEEAAADSTSADPSSSRLGRHPTRDHHRPDHGRPGRRTRDRHCHPGNGREGLMSDQRAPRRAVDPTTGQRLDRTNTYDWVIVGGGPNGLGIAAYLAKWGYSVCLLEARPELGGGAETAEPIPGYSIDPHAVYFYGAAGTCPRAARPRPPRLPHVVHPELRGLHHPRPEGLRRGEHLPRATPHAIPRRTSSCWASTATPRRCTWSSWSRCARRCATSSAPSTGRRPSTRAGASRRPRRRWRRCCAGCLPMYDDAMLEMSFMEMMDALGAAGSDPGRVAGRFLGQRPSPVLEGHGVARLRLHPAAVLLRLHPGRGHALPGSRARSVARCPTARKMYVNSPVSEIIVHDGVAKGVRVGRRLAARGEDRLGEHGRDQQHAHQAAPGLVSDSSPHHRASVSGSRISASRAGASSSPT